MAHNLFEKMDYFGEPIPNFNIRGRKSMRTQIGGICTVLVAITIIMYTTIKFVHLLTKYNPNINDYFVDKEIGTVANLNEQNVRIAFNVEDYYAPWHFKNDENYVKWIFRMYGKKDNEFFSRNLPYHACTEEEYDEFYPIEPIYEKLLDSIKKDDNRGFYCIDWDDEEPFEIYGSNLEADYQRMEMILVPCNLKPSGVNTIPDPIVAGCKANLED